MLLLRQKRSCTVLPMIFSLPSCIFTVSGYIGVTFLAHLVLLLVNPIFALAFWMTMRALREVLAWLDLFHAVAT